MGSVAQTLAKVHGILSGPLGLQVQLQEKDNAAVVVFEDTSTQVRFEVWGWGVNRDGEPRTLVRVSSPILRGVKPSPELFEWIARKGGDYFFGHVAAYDDQREPGTLFLLMTHTLLGDYLDEDELAAAMMGVLATADQLDDMLKGRFGGARWADA